MDGKVLAPVLNASHLPHTPVAPMQNSHRLRILLPLNHGVWLP